MTKYAPKQVKNFMELSKHESDARWFKRHCGLTRLPDDNQIEWFCERVAILMADGEFNETEARAEVFKQFIT